MKRKKKREWEIKNQDLTKRVGKLEDIMEKEERLKRRNNIVMKRGVTR